MAHRIHHLKRCRAVPGQPCSCEIKRYTYILAITIVIAAVQFTGSALSGSLALLADTMHVVLDGAGAGISVYVAYRARRHRDPERLRIFWMRVSGALLLCALVWVSGEAIHRFRNPQPVNGAYVMIVAWIGIMLNFFQHSLVPHDHSPTGNAQLQHIRGDIGSSAAVLLSGMAIYLIGWQWIDPLLSLGVSIVIGWSTLRMVLAPQPASGCGHSH